MFTIKHAARAVGVSEATLRAWERRYGIGSPLRSQAGYRLYDDAAVRALETMKHLVDEGWPVKSAAEETLRRLARDEADDAAPQHFSPEEYGDLDALVPLARSYDAPGLDDLLDERFASASFESVVDDWLLPALGRLGAAWEAGEVSVAGEHLVSHGVTRRLSVAYEAAGDAPFGAQVAIGLPPGARHDLGLLCFATAARRVGLAPRYLGNDVPTEDWMRAISPAGVRAVVLSAPLREDLEALQAVVDAVRLTRPDVLVAVGGAHQGDAPAYCLRLGHRIGDAAQELAVRLT
ncbi:MerR family transcriptional regulator [Nocardioides jishulii]|uniref:MerR family transcriptional regulator n=1 Tax=Nocardioides jishulii TaxID=2575440 RepID=A0A4U2YN50_9ACTN|nr:MerR family transcriptional regulator [Nocardioides jishulii]QCX27882.1 MerR family transcriptional regulator [Nocardioides jishulii]TKI62689.1 MerR family transcriptional regulator [Nocardioides jishulii]